MKSKMYLLLLWLLLSGHVLLASSSSTIAINNQARELVAPAAQSYQWYRDGARLPAATQQRLAVSQGGAYTLETVDGQGEKHSESIQIMVTDIGTIIRIFTIGDSTVQNYAAGFYPRAGWGQVLPNFFLNGDVTVSNQAVGGTSSKSFYRSFWPAVRNSLTAGDYVFIQFGINDRNNADTARYAPTGGVFEGYLTRYVNEARARGAIPVLVTTIRRNSWTNDTVVYNAYHDHPVAVRTVARLLNVPLIDLDARAKVLMESVGRAYSSSYWYNNYLRGEYPNYPTGSSDDVHFQEMGAIEMAKLVVDGINALSTDARISPLIPTLRNQYQVTTTANFPTAGLITRTTTYPPGVTITLKAMPATGHTFVMWESSPGTAVASRNIYSFPMGSAPVSYKAFFDSNATGPLATRGEALTEAGAAFVAPTPFTGETSITSAGKFHYRIIAVNGQVVESGVGNGTVQVGRHLASGLFVVLVQGTNNQLHSYKIVKQ
jgi:lysophospholipase L1-like esterase